MTRALLALLLAACAGAPAKRDWAAVDAVVREARWRTDNCENPSGSKCDAMWVLREELEVLMAKLKEQPERCKP